MAELTKEFFETQFKNLATKKDLVDLATKDDFNEVNEKLDFIMKNSAHKDDLKALATEKSVQVLPTQVKEEFEEQVTALSFIRRDIETLSKRTKQDDDAFNRELVKLRNRVDTLEWQLKKM